MEQRLQKAITEIADALDEHIDLGQPWSLTFYSNSSLFRDIAGQDYLTPEQKEGLEAYLEYNFKIWGDTWIKGEAQKLRAYAASIREVYTKLTVIDENALEEAEVNLFKAIKEAQERIMESRLP